MIEIPEHKEVDKSEKHLPQTFEQLIQMYDLNKLWLYLLKIINFANEEVPADIQKLIDDYELDDVLNFVRKASNLMDFNSSGKAMAIGKVSEASGDEKLFEVDMETKLASDVNHQVLSIDGKVENFAEASISYNRKGEQKWVVGAGAGDQIPENFGWYSSVTGKQCMKLDNSGRIETIGEHYNQGNLRALPSGNGDRAYWNNLENGVYWYGNTGAVPGMPSEWGFVEKKGFVSSGSDWTVMYYPQSSGNIYRRSGNLNTDSGWRLTGLSDISAILRKSNVGDINWNSQTDGDATLITKSAIAFWNGAYSESNSNLQYCKGGEIQEKPTILYSNGSGTSGTVTLSASTEGWKNIRISFLTTDGYYSGMSFSDTSSVSGKTYAICSSLNNSDKTRAYFTNCLLTVNGTSVTFARNWQLGIDTVEDTSYWSDATIKVTKIEVWN